MSKSKSIAWNSKVRLILADVDQTVADDFVHAEDDMISELTALLEEGKSIFFVTGGPLNRLRTRLIDKVPEKLKYRILVAHCSGAEVWGFEKNGHLREEPFYSVYDQKLSDQQKRVWREVMGQLVSEFKLEKHKPMPVEYFREKTKNHPMAVIYEDRGPQITLEVVNGYDLTGEQIAVVQRLLPEINETKDLREPMRQRAVQLLEQAKLPITPKFGGVFALDFPLEGISKEDTVRRVLARPEIINSIGVDIAELEDPLSMEIWGDRFDRDMGTDWLMCSAVDPDVRAIDFRFESPDRFPENYNIVVWSGKHQLHGGLLEYLLSRH